MYDSDYDVRLATLESMGGDASLPYDSVYDIDLEILKKVQEGGGGGTTYSAGDNISISDENVISSKNWIDDEAISGLTTCFSASAVTAYVEQLRASIAAKQDTLIAGENITISGNTISASGGGGSVETHNVTYAELVDLTTGGTLVAGDLYRITDFVTTTVQENTQSANHPYDIILRAISNSELDENVYHFALHEGDTYFANSDLYAWKGKYCLLNDTTRFAWADTTNGKGVVYRLIDEFDNDVCYDFKNIQYYVVNGYNNNSNSTNPTWYYTFESYALTYDLSIEGKCKYNTIATSSNSLPFVQFNIGYVYSSANWGEMSHNIFVNCQNVYLGSGYIRYNDFTEVERLRAWGTSSGYYIDYNTLKSVRRYYTTYDHWLSVHNLNCSLVEFVTIENNVSYTSDNVNSGIFKSFIKSCSLSYASNSTGIKYSYINKCSYIRGQFDRVIAVNCSYFGGGGSFDNSVFLNSDYLDLSGGGTDYYITNCSYITMGISYVSSVRMHGVSYYRLMSTDTLSNTQSGGRIIVYPGVNGNSNHYIDVDVPIRNDKGYVTTFGLLLPSDKDTTKITYLSDLTVGGTTVSGFSKYVTEYNVNTTIDTVDATKEMYFSTVTINQADPLLGTATVVVTAANKYDTKTYTIQFLVPDYDIKGLSWDNGTVVATSYEVVAINNSTDDTLENASSYTTYTVVDPTVTVTEASQVEGIGIKYNLQWDANDQEWKFHTGSDTAAFGMCGIRITRGGVTTTYYLNLKDATAELVKFTSNQDGSTIGLIKKSSNQTLEYSSDAINWTSMTTSTSITLNNGDFVYFRGILSNHNYLNNNYTQFNINGNISVSGNGNSLLNYNNPNVESLTLTCCLGKTFDGCTGLTDASQLRLPSTSLSNDCYISMFNGCTNLAGAPELPALTIPYRGYNHLFYGCSALNYVKCLATNISASYSHDNWLEGTAATGTFVKNPNMSGWPVGTVHGIPSGWTIQDAVL